MSDFKKIFRETIMNENQELNEADNDIFSDIMEALNIELKKAEKRMRSEKEEEQKMWETGFYSGLGTAKSIVSTHISASKTNKVKWEKDKFKYVGKFKKS